MPNAKVDLTNTGTGQTVSTLTDTAGRFSVPNLQPGTYNLTVAAAGFRTYQRSGTVVTANTLTRADLRLDLGAASEQVTVSADAAALQTDKADTHTTLSSQSISQLPLPGYRNYQSLENLVPGATPAQFQNSMTDTPGLPVQNGDHVSLPAAQVDLDEVAADLVVA